jgi:hypothetical protein
MLNAVILSVIMMSVVIRCVLNVNCAVCRYAVGYNYDMYCYSQYHFAEWHYAKCYFVYCNNAECHRVEIVCPECCFAGEVMLTVIMLSVINV